MGSLRERNHLKDIVVDGMIMFQCFLNWDGCIGSIQLSQDAVDAVMNSRVPSNAGMFLST